MSHGVRLALLTAAVAGSYAAGFHLRERTGSRPRVGEALYLLGVLLFGASLFLVGQMYNVEAHDPLALLLWAGGATATALVVRSRAIAAAAVLIFTSWVGFEFGLALDDGGYSFAAFPVVAVFYGGALYGLATTAQERVREHWFAEQRLSRVGPRRRAAGRGGGAVRLHLLRCDQGARARGRGAGWLPARGASAPGRARVRGCRRARALASAQRPLRGRDAHHRDRSDAGRHARGRERGRLGGRLQHPLRRRSRSGSSTPASSATRPGSSTSASSSSPST